MSNCITSRSSSYSYLTFCEILSVYFTIFTGLSRPGLSLYSCPLYSAEFVSIHYLLTPGFHLLSLGTSAEGHDKYLNRLRQMSSWTFFSGWCLKNCHNQSNNWLIFQTTECNLKTTRSSLLFTFLLPLLLLYLPEVFSYSRKIKVPITTSFFGIPALCLHSQFIRILSLWSKTSVFRFHPRPMFLSCSFTQALGFYLAAAQHNSFLCHIKWVVINSSYCDCWF